MADFIQRNDQEFRAQATLVSAVVGAAPTNYGQTAPTMTAFGDLVGLYASALEDHVTTQELARARTQAKDDARALLVAVLRSLNGVAQTKAT